MKVVKKAVKPQLRIQSRRDVDNEKNNKPAAKRYMKTVGMVMASVMVFLPQPVRWYMRSLQKTRKILRMGKRKKKNYRISEWKNGK